LIYYLVAFLPVTFDLVTLFDCPVDLHLRFVYVYVVILPVWFTFTRYVYCCRGYVHTRSHVVVCCCVCFVVVYVAFVDSRFVDLRLLLLVTLPLIALFGYGYDLRC